MVTSAKPLRWLASAWRSSCDRELLRSLLGEGGKYLAVALMLIRAIWPSHVVHWQLKWHLGSSTPALPSPISRVK